MAGRYSLMNSSVEFSSTWSAESTRGRNLFLLTRLSFNGVSSNALLGCLFLFFFFFYYFFFVAANDDKEDTVIPLLQLSSPGATKTIELCASGRFLPHLPRFYIFLSISLRPSLSRRFRHPEDCCGLSLRPPPKDSEFRKFGSFAALSGA